MLTTIDNTQRKFLVQSLGFGNTVDIFCNLKDIPAVLKESLEPHQEFKVYEFWNRKLARLSKKRLNEILAANKIDFKIK